MKKLVYKIGRGTEEEHWGLDFQDGLSRSVGERIQLGLIPTKIPEIDNASYRIFASMKEYRKWAEQNLPRHLGYWR